MNKRKFLKSLPLASPLILSACGGISLGSNLLPQFLLKTDVIQTELDNIFPFARNLNQVGGLQLSNPILGTAPEINKMRLGLGLTGRLSPDLALATSIPHLKALASEERSGQCQIACGFRYDPKTRDIFLHEPVIESLELGGFPDYYSNQISHLVNLLGSQMFSRTPVHTLDDTFANRRLKSFQVQNDGVALQFGI